MKSNYFSNIVCIVLLAALIGCGDRFTTRGTNHPNHNTDTSGINISMADSGGILSSIPVVTATTGKQIVSIQLSGRVTYDPRKEKTISSRIAGRIEQLNIKYNYQPVQKGQVIMQIYSPDLAAAQQELLYLHASGETAMAERARERLKLMGMEQALIDKVIKTKEVVYNVPVYSSINGYILEKASASQPPPGISQPVSGMASMGEASSTTLNPSSQQTPPVQGREVSIRQGQYVAAGQQLFVVYDLNDLLAEFAVTQEMSRYFSKGQKILFNPQHAKNEIHQGTIALIEPMFREGQNFSIIRTYINEKSFQAGELLNGTVAVVFDGGWWLPRGAVWFTGSRAIVFRKTGGRFEPVPVTVITSVDERVLLSSDVTNWKISSNASYMVDSESFIDLNEQKNKYEE